MRVVVTGGAGFIGSHIADRLLERGDEVFCIDIFNNYYDWATGHVPKFSEGDTACGIGPYAMRKDKNIKEALNCARYTLVRDVSHGGKLVNIRDYISLSAAFPDNIDALVHTAALAGVQPSKKLPKLYDENNVGGSENLLTIGYAKGVRNFVMASSSSVYGDNPHFPWREDMALSPQCTYAETKMKMEQKCAEFASGYPDARITMPRFFTVYGPRGRPDMAPYLFAKKMMDGTEIPMRGDGSTQRDYTYVDDIVRGVIACVDNPQRLEVINLGNNTPVTLTRFIQATADAVGVAPRIKQVPKEEGDVDITYADNSKAERLLGWKPTTSVEDGMKKFVAWYRAHELKKD
jgi:UDP-glucuronate 4-epimerase